MLLDELLKGNRMSWVQTNCPECDSENWYNDSLCNTLHTDGLECHQCSHLFMFAEANYSTYDPGQAFAEFVRTNRPFESDEEEYTFYEEGRVHPNLKERRQKIYREFGIFPRGELL